MTCRDRFGDFAGDYAAHRPRYPLALARVLAHLAPDRRLAWEAGCGTGQLSTVLAERFERVIATDASAEMIRHVAPHAGVEYRCAPAEASGLPDAAAGLSVAAQAAHWFDLDAYYAEVRRVTRPGGVVALVTYGRPSVGPEIDPLMTRFHSEVLGRYWPPERRHVEDGYRSLPFPFDELEAPALEMRLDWTPRDLLGYMATWSAVRELENAEGGEPLGAFRRDLLRAWGPDAPARRVRWPLSMRVGRV